MFVTRNKARGRLAYMNHEEREILCIQRIAQDRGRKCSIVGTGNSSINARHSFHRGSFRSHRNHWFSLRYACAPRNVDYPLINGGSGKCGIVDSTHGARVFTLSVKYGHSETSRSFLLFETVKRIYY